jgi:hypothetical protein
MLTGWPADAVARWKRFLIAARGACMVPGPDPAKPGDVAAYGAAVRQLVAEAATDLQAAEAVAWIERGRGLMVCLGTAAEPELELP